MSSRQTLIQPQPQPTPSAATEATSPSSSAHSTTATPTSRKEVTTMAQRIRRILRSTIGFSIDGARIDAHRDAVQRELGLSRPIL